MLATEAEEDGITVETIEYDDNLDVIELIEKNPGGIVSTIDDEL